MKKQNDILLTFIIVILACCSCLFIYSSSSIGQYEGDFVLKQIVFYLLGFILMFFVSLFDLEQLKKMSWIFYGFIVLLLILLIFAPVQIARPINGAKAWFQVPFIGTFQPSEFLKFSFVILVSSIIEKHFKKFQLQTYKSDLFLISKILLITVPPMIVVFKQPDSGMVMLYLSMLIPMVLFSGIKKGFVILFSFLSAATIGGFIIIYVKFNQFFNDNILSHLSPHQVVRINGWLNPFNNSDAAFQTSRSLLAIGSGELKGKGYLENHVYIPEKHTDFIFSSIGEEFGFIGGTLLIILFFLLIQRIVSIVLKSNDLFCSSVGIGIIGLLSFQVFQNIGMTIGLLPVTGVTLPFLSYGGSSLLSNMMLLGIVHAIKKSYSGYMF